MGRDPTPGDRWAPTGREELGIMGRNCILISLAATVVGRQTRETLSPPETAHPVRVVMNAWKSVIPRSAGQRAKNMASHAHSAGHRSSQPGRQARTRSTTALNPPLRTPRAEGGQERPTRVSTSQQTPTPLPLRLNAQGARGPSSGEARALEDLRHTLRITPMTLRQLVGQGSRPGVLLQDGPGSCPGRRRGVPRLGSSDPQWGEAALSFHPRTLDQTDSSSSGIRCGLLGGWGPSSTRTPHCPEKGGPGLNAEAGVPAWSTEA